MAVPVDPVPATSNEVTLVGEAAPSFEAFYEDTHARLYTALCLVTGSRHEAEEVMQEAFVRLWERRDRIGQLETPTGYLYPRRDEPRAEPLPAGVARGPADGRIRAEDRRPRRS
jgi:hypothetical protein